jgi:hypothetical protein
MIPLRTGVYIIVTGNDDMHLLDGVRGNRRSEVLCWWFPRGGLSIAGVRGASDLRDSLVLAVDRAGIVLEQRDHEVRGV